MHRQRDNPTRLRARKPSRARKSSIDKLAAQTQTAAPRELPRPPLRAPTMRTLFTNIDDKHGAQQSLTWHIFG